METENKPSTPTLFNLTRLLQIKPLRCARPTCPVCHHRSCLWGGCHKPQHDRNAPATTNQSLPLPLVCQANSMTLWNQSVLSKPALACLLATSRHSFVRPATPPSPPSPPSTPGYGAAEPDSGGSSPIAAQASPNPHRWEPGPGKLEYPFLRQISTRLLSMCDAVRPAYDAQGSVRIGARRCLLFATLTTCRGRPTPPPPPPRHTCNLLPVLRLAPSHGSFSDEATGLLVSLQ